jgi:hypothetical protein
MPGVWITTIIKSTAPRFHYDAFEIPVTSGGGVNSFGNHSVLTFIAPGEIRGSRQLMHATSSDTMHALVC